MEAIFQIVSDDGVHASIVDFRGVLNDFLSAKNTGQEYEWRRKMGI